MRPIVAALLLAGSALPGAALAFREASAGTPIRDRTMPTVDGKRAALLASGKVGVFVFVRAGHDHSLSALQKLAQLEGEFEAKPVRFVAIVSDTEVPADVQALAREAGVRMPVLVDEADAFYGELGVAMLPSAGIVGRDGRLTGFQPFRKVNYLDAMRGRVQVALGELDEAGLARVLDPGVQAAPSGGRARARLRLARTLLAAGSVEQALESARASVALEPDLAEAHQVLSEALARAGRCDEAEAAAAAARKLAPDAKTSPAPCVRR
jgi:predicted Zn-dependent protease